MSYKARTIFLILFFALFVRIIYIFLFYQGTGADNDGYFKIARNIAHYGKFSFDGQNRTAFRPPFYPLVISPLAYLSENFHSVYLFQAIINILTCYLIFLLAKRIDTLQTAKISLIIAAIYPHYIYYCGEILTEIWGVFLMTILLLVIKNLLNQDISNITIDLPLATGLSLGLGILCKASFLAFLPLIAIFHFFSSINSFRLESISKYVIKAFLPLLIGVLVALAPWALRNFLVFSRFIITTTNGGYTFYEGNNSHFYLQAIVSPDPTGRWEAENWQKWREELFKATENMTEPEADKYFYAQGVKYIKEHPIWFLKGTLIKMLWFLNPLPKIENKMLKIVGLLSDGTLIPLIILGIITSIKKDKVWSLYLIMVAIILLIYGIYWSQIRYRLLISPLLLIWASIGINEILKGFNKGILNQKSA